MKPMLAQDWIEEKLTFPKYIQPKIDGVRGINTDGILTGRSLKKHKNVYTTSFYSREDAIGFDGELAANAETHPDLCRITASALSTVAGQPYTIWHLFDYITPSTIMLPYEQRYQLLVDRVAYVRSRNLTLRDHLKVVPSELVRSMSHLQEIDAKYLEMGYEGSCLRDPFKRHKQGRSTVLEGGLLRIKRFVDAEAAVIRYEEGNHNANEATTNELGKTARSSHQENMIPNGQVGTIIAWDLVNKMEIKVSPGNMTVEERISAWNNRFAAQGKIFTYKHFPKGVKNLPRFPTFKSWRDASDIS